MANLRQCSHCRRAIADEHILSVCCYECRWSFPTNRTPFNLDDAIAKSTAAHESRLRFGCSSRETQNVRDIDSRLHILMSNMRRDFEAIGGMINAIENKFRALEDLFGFAELADKLRANASPNYSQMEQISRKCDQILRKLDVIDSKRAQIVLPVGNSNAYSFNQLSLQLLNISKHVKKLGDQATTHNKDVLEIKEKLEKFTTEAKGEPTVKESKKDVIKHSKLIDHNSRRRNQTLGSTSNAASHKQLTVTQSTDNQAEPDIACLEMRLRDSKVMNVVRIYLSYLSNQPASVCYDGMTNASARMFLALEGFPVAVDKLRDIYIRVHETNGISKESALADLSTYKSYIASERIQRLQRARESSDKFYGRYPPKQS